jgi:hypothetical protein
MSVLKTPIHTHPFTLSKYAIGECIYLDYIERLKPDEDGYDHILVVIDAFSRWVELIPTKGNLALNTAKALIKHVGRFGCPVTMMSDNGKSFVADIIKEITTLLGTNHQTTMAYSKEENDMVERANKEVIRHLKNIIFDKNVIKLWSIYLPSVQRIRNSSKHSAIGCTPAQLVHANAIDLDRGFVLEHQLGNNPEEKLSKWVSDTLVAQTFIMEVARKKLRERDEVHMQTHIPVGHSNYAINSYVLVEHRHNSLMKGPSSKLLPYLKGPQRVVGFSGDKYTLECLLTSTRTDYHVS